MRLLIALAGVLTVGCSDAHAQLELKKLAKPEVYRTLQQHHLLASGLPSVKTVVSLQQLKVSDPASGKTRNNTTEMLAYEYSESDGLIAAIQPLFENGQRTGIKHMSVTAARGLVTIFDLGPSAVTETGELEILQGVDFPMTQGAIFRYRQLRVSGPRDSNERNGFLFIETTCIALPPVVAKEHSKTETGDATPIQCTVRALDAKKAIQNRVYELAQSHPDPVITETFIYLPRLDWAYLWKVNGRTVEMDRRILELFTR
jgi:hypothetical protein